MVGGFSTGSRAWLTTGNSATITMQPDTQAIERELANAGFGNSFVHAFDVLDSTSLWLREKMLKGELQGVGSNTPVPSSVHPGDATTHAFASSLLDPPNHVCVTHWQYAGIARRGRTWQTKPGNITFSILSTTHAEPRTLPGLSLVTGIAVAECLVQEHSLPVQLKWPNDVLMNGLKLGGLLTEVTSLPAAQGGATTSQVLTGIGINLLHDSEVLGLGIGATSLEYAGVSTDSVQRDLLVAKIAASVLSAHQQFHDTGWPAFGERWQALDWLAGKEVAIHSDTETEHAVACGVNEQGALLVQRAGNIYPLYSGNVSVRPTV